MTKDSDSGTLLPDPEPPIDTTNEFLLGARGHHGLGLGAYIAPTFHPRFATRQQAYRFGAWLETMAEVLPEEDGAYTYEQIRDAIRRT